jgi:protease-4
MSHRARVLLLVVLLVMSGFAAFTVAVALRGDRHLPRGQVFLTWDVPADLDDAPPLGAPPFSFAALRLSRPSLFEITEALRRAADDDDVRALVLHVGDVQWGWARVAGMREALARFRAAGKPVYVAMQGGSDQAYLLVAGADRVALTPTGTLYLDGLTASALFLKGTYDKLGIRPNFAHVGTFKSAVEQYTRTDLSPAARQAMESLLDDEFGLLVDSLASARHVTSERMRALIDEGPFTASQALAAGLVDTLADPASLDRFVTHARHQRLTALPIARYLRDPDQDLVGDHVALIPAAGTIMGGRSRDDGWNGATLGSETLISALHDAADRHEARAVVLWIDSPGGDGLASDEVWREVQRVRMVKPVIVSMSNLAASGGYYIACGASVIVAEPATLTGSIGVFGGKLNLLGLYRKLGLNVESVSRGRHAEMMSPFRDFSPDEAARFQSSLDAFYQVFLRRVAEGRGMSTGAVDSVGQGRVWSGMTALRLGLADTLGGLPTALSIARDRAGAPANLPVLLYPHPRALLWRRFVQDLVHESPEDARLAQLSPVLGAWMQASAWPAGRVLALMPFELDVR